MYDYHTMYCHRLENQRSASNETPTCGPNQNNTFIGNVRDEVTYYIV